MKIIFTSIFLLLLTINAKSLTKLIKDTTKQLKNKKKERKLYENLTTSFLLGDTVDTNDTSHLSLLVSQQKAMENFKVIGNWVSDIEERLDDLRDSVNRRVSDMAIGLQRRNMLLGHYNAQGKSNGNLSADYSRNDPYTMA